jgi:RNA polymerase sigma factor (sigma-70 family)
MDIKSLYRNAIAGDKKSEQKLFDYLTDSFRLFLQLRIRNRQDAEEIVQEALYVIARKYKEIDYDISFASWAYRILKNKFMDYLKHKKVRDRVMMREQEAYNPGTIDFDPDVRRQLLLCLEKVGGANLQFARILNLHYQGYNRDEICKRLKLRTDYFYVVLSRARSMLNICLDKGDVK